MKNTRLAVGESKMDLGLIWVSFSGHLRTHLTRKVPCQDVDDLLQDVFVALIRNPPPSNAAMPAWLWALVRNQVANYYRSKKMACQPLSGEFIQPENVGVGEAEAEVASWLEDMVNSLPEKYARPLAMSDFEGASMRDVAESTGLSLSGAKSRVQRGRAMLAKALTTCCSFHFDEAGHVNGWEKRQKKPRAPRCCQG